MELKFNGDKTEVVIDPSTTARSLCSNSLDIQANNIDTVFKLFQRSCSRYAKKDFLGTRKLIGTKTAEADNGKLLDKLILEDKYTWQSYEEVSQRVENIAKGLHSLGKLDKVAIFAETCAEWIMVAMACFQSSVVLGTLFANLGDDGIVSGLRQLQCSVIFTR